MGIVSTIATVIAAIFAVLDYFQQRRVHRQTPVVTAPHQPWWGRWLPLMVLGLALSTWIPYFWPRPVTDALTAQNVADVMRSWIDKNRLQVQVMAPEAPAIFEYRVTLNNGNNVIIIRPKDNDGFIEFDTAVKLGIADSAIFEKLTAQQKSTLLLELQQEFARRDLGYTILPQPLTVALFERVPISGLSEFLFLKTLFSTDTANILASASVTLDLQRLQEEKRQ